MITYLEVSCLFVFLTQAEFFLLISFGKPGFHIQIVNNTQFGFFSFKTQTQKKKKICVGLFQMFWRGPKWGGHDTVQEGGANTAR